MTTGRTPDRQVAGPHDVDRPFPHELPVDPDVDREDHGTVAATGPRRRAEPRQLWPRLRRALASRRDILGVIAVGGAIGSLGRWSLTVALPHQPDAFAWATFIANVSGCLLIGALMVFVTEVWPPSRYLRPFLGVGVLGGYTTFSTAMLDTRSLLVSGRPGLAGVYLFGSAAAGLIAVWVAIVAARTSVVLARRRRQRRLPDSAEDGRSLGKFTRPDVSPTRPIPARAAPRRKS